MPLLEVKDLTVQFKLGRRKLVHAVNGVSLNVEQSESVGLVGESGCGKSTLGYAVLQLVPITAGQIQFNGRDVRSLRGKQMPEFRRQMQMIFQDPYGSLNPRMSIGSALDECLLVHHLGNKKERKQRVQELLETVGLSPDYALRYPHEFSGGQRQRIGIARALALNPFLIIADEPVSALDVSVQAQILNLMKDIQQQRALSYLFIAHDLAVVRYMCDRIYVMYLGEIMEMADKEGLFACPAHPYTQALLAAVPEVQKGKPSNRKTAQRIVLKGEVPSSLEAVTGCAFHHRCPGAEDICRTQKPDFHVLTPSHQSRCHFVEKFANPTQA